MEVVPVDAVPPDEKEEEEIIYIVVKCEACGGSTKLAKGKIGACDYCGSSIIGELKKA